MQCADCHNRQGHSFEQPEEVVDSAISEGQIPLGLPFAHKTAVEILKASYSNEDAVNSGIPAAFTAFYQQKYPDIATKRADDIKRAGQTLVSLYQRNVFPDLGVKWGIYTNNLGHADNSIGLLPAATDENHATPQKKTISQDCSLCHNPLAVEETSPPVLKTLGLDQKLSALLKQ